MFTLQDKVVLITGGCGGIGFAFAKELLTRGAKGLTLVDVNEVIGKEKTKELQDEFGYDRVIFVKQSVDDESFKKVFDATIDKFNQLDIVVNNAAVIDEFDWKKCVDVNLKGTMQGTFLAIHDYFPKYKSGDESVLVNISSISGIQTNGQLPTYTATKFGVTGFTRTFGDKTNYAKYQTRVLGFCPGYTKTNIYNLMRSKIPPSMSGEIRQSFGNIKSQEPDVVAKALCKMIEIAEHGSFWSIEDSITYELTFSPEEPIKTVLNL